MKILVVLTETAEMEVDLKTARAYLGAEADDWDDFTIAEVYASYVEGQEVELAWERNITAVSILEEETCTENS